MARGPTPPSLEPGACGLSIGLRRRSDGRLGSATPQPFEPMPGNTGVMGGVLGIAVTEVVLHGAQIGALVGQVSSRRSGAACAARRAGLRGSA